MHTVQKPAILYFGTPVVLISSLNDDGSTNLSPMSSIFWLGWRAVLGLSAVSQTTLNLRRSPECVLNLASEREVAGVDRLALTTASNPVPASKVARGYRCVRDKFTASGFTPDPSETVAPSRVRECPVQLEASVVSSSELACDDARLRGSLVTFEVRVQRVHVDASLLMEGHANRIDPQKWRPLIMSFQEFYGLSREKLQPSTLASIPERLYRSA